MRTRTWRYAGGAALLALALAGCDSGMTPSPGGSPSRIAESAVPSPTSAAPTAPATSPLTSATSPAPTRTPAADVAVSLVRSGGFAGRTETITVRPDGSWTHGDGSGADHRGRLSAAQRARLQTLAKDPRLAAEAKQPPAAGKCNDTYTYLLRVGSRRIKYEQCPGTGAPPKVTLEIIGLLEDATG